MVTSFDTLKVFVNVRMVVALIGGSQKVFQTHMQDTYINKHFYKEIILYGHTRTCRRAVIINHPDEQGLHWQKVILPLE